MNRTPRHKPRFAFRPQIDVLEKRAMLAADLGFTPILPANTVNSNGGTAPFALTADLDQTVIQRRSTDADLGAQLGQNTINESGPFAGRFLFTAALETSSSNGGADPIIGTLNRTHLATGETINLLDIAIDDSDDPADPDATYLDTYTLQNVYAVRWTPWGTLLVAESIAGLQLDAGGNPNDQDAGSQNGLIYEVLDPTGARPTIIARPNVGSANFQGLDFDSEGNLYYTDNAGGNSTLFRFVPDDVGPTSLESGTLQVLHVTSGTTGAAEWETIYETSNPGGFDPAVSVRAALLNIPFTEYTTFQTLRDVEVGFGNLTGAPEDDEILYVAVQLANRVLAIDLEGNLGNPFVYDYFNTDVNAAFNDPVDLAIDSEGRVYIGEADVPPPAAGTPGNEIWVGADDPVDNDFAAATDGNVANDGVLRTTVNGDLDGRLAVLRVSNASIAGLYVNPFNNNQIYVNSSSTEVAKNAIVRFQADGGFAPSVELIPVGNPEDGETVLVITGTETSDRILISGYNILTVRIGNQTFKGLAPSQNVIIYGLGGSDTITTGSGSFFDYTVFGGGGSDYIVTGEGFDAIAGEDGNDRIQAGQGNNSVSGGEGNDTLTAGRGDDFLSGDNGNDRLTGGDGNDTMFGGAGNDTLNAGRGEDFLDGGSGNDQMDGYIGDDILVGRAGNDHLVGGRGRDVLIGGQDKDLLYAGDESDLLIADITAADDDEAALRGLLELWLMSTVSEEAGDDIQAYLDELDGVTDGDGITQDNSLVDLLDGGPGLTDDLYFRFGTRDILYRVNVGDDVVVVL